MKAINPFKIILSTLMTATMLTCCTVSEEPKVTELKDLPTTGYEYSFFQAARGTDHNREIKLWVNKLNDYPGQTFNLLEGTYDNVGTEAYENLRDPVGRSILAQSEMRRYFDFWDNARNDLSNITLIDPVSKEIYSAMMSRFKTEWWGNSDARAIKVNGGPTILRIEGDTNHLGIETQQVFAEAVRYDTDDAAFFDQSQAGYTKNFFTAFAKKLEKTGFTPADEHILIATYDSDSLIDWLGVETIPAQGELYDGNVSYVIAASYLGSHNQAFSSSDWLGEKMFGHQGAPDRSNKVGNTLDTILLGLGRIDTKEAWVPKAKIIVNHPHWSNQTEYQFIKVDETGKDILMGSLQRTYNDLTQKETTSEGDTIVTDVKGVNNYLAKGDLQFMNDVLTLLGGQQVPLGIDYKTSYMDYGLDMVMAGAGLITPEGMDPEQVAWLNVNADTTIMNVVDAAKNVFGVEPTQFFADAYGKQLQANSDFQEKARQDKQFMELYGLDQ